ncbi:hypothetical protein [Enterococcus gilvus]|uniref:hypothetical protein n=1 Tax=Enterococcus gilvus TaxID=160453 RepID=UPI003ED9FCA2
MIVSNILSGAAILLNAFAIYKTGKSFKTTSNQFLFTKRSEIIDLYRAVLSVIDLTHLQDFTEDENYANSIIHGDIPTNNFTNLISVEFLSIVSDDIFKDLYTTYEAVVKDSFDEEMNKIQCFGADLRKKIKLTESIFSDEELKKTIIEVLTGYDNLLSKFTRIFRELDQENWANSITYLLREHEEFSKEFYDLKNKINNINKNEIDKKIAKEFKLF